MKRLLIAVGALSALGLGTLLAQQIVQQALTGNEAVLVQLGGPGGTGVFTNVSALRDAADVALMPSSATITQTVSPSVGKLVVLGAVTTLNLSLPTQPYNGQVFSLSCPGGAITTLVVSAPQPVSTPATSINGQPATTCANTPSTSMIVEYVFSTSPNVWNRLQ